jgi:superfamily I DNA/RNA helicase
MAKLLPGIGTRSADTLWLGVEEALNRSSPPLLAHGAPALPAVTPAVETPPEPPAAPSAFAPADEPTQPLPETIANPWAGLPPVKDLLAPLKVPAKAQKAWQQLAFTLDELVPNGHLAPPAQMIESVMEAVYDDYLLANYPNYEQRREDLNTLANFSKQYESPQAFLDQLALLTGLDTDVTQRKEETDRVVLTSVHQAKGLEWKVVFVIWLADGKFPSTRSMETAEAIEEERRLFYVSVTRAKDELYLSYPCVSYSQGYGDPLQRPSRFLGELPRQLLEEWEVGGVF